MSAKVAVSAARMALQTPAISKRYGNQWVLRDVSLLIAPGKVLALLGPSRSGKTTLLRILAGLEQASPKGVNIDWNGNAVLLHPQPNESLLTRLFGHGEWHSRGVEKFQGILESSTGVLLLDDPLRGRSEAEIEPQCNAIRSAARDRALSVVYTTANFRTAALIADRIAVLAKGTVIQTGAPATIYDTPLTTEIAKLTGRCNIIEARRLTSSKSDCPEFQTITGGHRLFTERADVARLGPINRNVPLAIRPENVEISFGASFPEDNLVKATVTGTQFLGPTTIVELNANGLQLEAMVFRVVGLNIGDECMVALPPERIRILND
ncbi:MAG TPA: ATP-binding cassette domain-containing protein [Pyrinomonadaceae bacterium]|jgi:ABC-type Fe3+/spermidine/putrescine transport system ATPase subunit